MAEVAEKVELQPKYYLEYFNYVLDFVQDKYKHILNESEWRFLRKYYCLSEDAQCLFIRFTNRRGLFFKTNKLIYNELRDIPNLLNELTEREFVEKPSVQKHLTFGQDLLHIFSKDELLKIIQNLPETENAKSFKKLKKEELIAAVLQNYPYELIIEAINEKEAIIKVNFEFETTFMKFLFFGNRYMDMTEFVVRDLGLIQFETHDDDKLVARFNTRKDAEDKWFITDQNDLFNQLKDIVEPLEIYDWILNVNNSVNDLSEIAKPSYERLVIKIGAFLEKNKHLEESISVYKLTEQVPSRERQARILHKLNLNDEALALCYLMIDEPKNADERFFASDLVNKIQSKKRISKKSTTSWLHQSDSITISEEYRGQVELGTIAYFNEEGMNAVFAENHLWRAIFGLIFWDIVFDPALVAFHHPFQRRPSDLYLPDFYQKRKELIISHLDSFQEIHQLLTYMGECYENKFGIANPFVVWLEEIWLMVRKAVEVIELDSLKKILLEMSKNLVENLRGFPDLFVWNEKSYTFIEVKSPTDNLSNQQLYWLQYFEEIGVKSKVLRVFWHSNEQG
jgi:hypothetical protein